MYIWNGHLPRKANIHRSWKWRIEQFIRRKMIILPDCEQSKNTSQCLSLVSVCLFVSCQKYVTVWHLVAISPFGHLSISEIISSVLNRRKHNKGLSIYLHIFVSARTIFIADPAASYVATFRGWLQMIINTSYCTLRKMNYPVWRAFSL